MIRNSPFSQKQLLASSVNFLNSASEDDSVEGTVIGMILTLLIVTGAPALCYVATALLVGIYFMIDEEQGEKNEY